MKKINDNFYFNSNSISALYLANAVVTVILADGGEVTIDDDTFNAIAEDISSFKVNDNFYINPAQIVKMTFFDGEYKIVLVNDIRLEVSEEEFTNLVGNDCINKVNDNLYINPNHIVGLASANGNRIITMVNNIQFEVSEDEYSIVSEMEPITGTGENVVLPYGQTNPNLYLGQVFSPTNGVIEIDLEKLVIWLENNNSEYYLEWYSGSGGSDAHLRLSLIEFNKSHNPWMSTTYTDEIYSIQLVVAASSAYLSFTNESGYNLGDYTIAVNDGISTLKELILKTGVVKITPESFDSSGFTKLNYAPLIVQKIDGLNIQTYVSNSAPEIVERGLSVDFVKIYNV